MPAIDLARLPRLGGRLCLDFVNTIDPRHGADRLEYLPDFDALADWAAWSGAMPAEHRKPLRLHAAAAPARAAAVHRRALALRENLYELFRPTTSTRLDDRLDAFNRELRRASRHAILIGDGASFQIEWDATHELDQMLWPIARSAVDLLADARALQRVRECDGHNCGWLFLDTSKAGRRRWCSMDICGNRAKSQRYRRRAHAA
jgi:predicted RNA-binding Zn ribbon-like protein